MGTSFLVVNLEGEDDDSLINTEEVNRTRELNFKSTQNEDFSRRASTDQVHSEITIKIFGGANYGEILYISFIEL